MDKDKKNDSQETASTQHVSPCLDSDGRNEIKAEVEDKRRDRAYSESDKGPHHPHGRPRTRKLTEEGYRYHEEEYFDLF